VKVKVSQVVFFLAAEMTVVLLGALAWKWPLNAVFADEPRRVIGQAAVMAFCPLWLMCGWLIAQRRLVTAIPKPSEDYRQWTETSLVASGLAMAVMQGWTARNFIMDDSMGRLAMLRAITVFLGALTAAQGNFLAKVAPPSGPGAPAPGVWTRIALRSGWTMALVGLGVMVCALTLRMPALFLVPVAATLVLLVNAIHARRAMRSPA
jgi:hypothetical protein